MKSHSAKIRVPTATHEVESRNGPDIGVRVADFLRRRHPLKTADNVAAETGIPVNTVKTWLQRGSVPDGKYCTTLWIVYGPDFLAVLAGSRTPEWVKQMRRAHDAMQLKADIAALERKLAGVLP